MNAEQLKQQALDELQKENSSNEATSGTPQQVETKLSGEVIAEIITFDNLQAKLRSGNVANMNAKISELLKESKHDEIAQLIANQKSETLQLANNLPRYILLTEDGTNYLVEAPKVAIKSNNSNGEKRTNGQKYPSPFNIGDHICLINKEGTVSSQIYQVTQASLIGNDDHEPIKASKAVRNFMVNQLGKIENPTGYAGTSFGMWEKVVQ